MKFIALYLLIFLFCSCNGQEVKNRSYAHHYEEELYKGWSIDTIRNSFSDRKYLMNGNDRVEIFTDSNNHIIYIEKSNIISAYIYTFTYDLNSKAILARYNYFFSSAIEPIGYQLIYDRNGQLIKKKNWDRYFKFTIEKLIQKFKKEYKTNINNRANLWKFQKISYFKALNGPLYTVVLRTANSNRRAYYFIDGVTGKTLFEKIVTDGNEIDLSDDFLKSLKDR